MTLVCFALPEEAGPFRKRLGSRPDVKLVLTGVGPANAAKAIGTALAADQPALVISAGFAGGLDPELRPGTIVFDAGADLEAKLIWAGGRCARLLCAPPISP